MGYTHQEKYAVANSDNSSDIEQEANGLYSFDRKEKLDAKKVKEVFGSAMNRFYERIGAKNPEI